MVIKVKDEKREIPSLLSGYNSAIPLPGAGVRSLVGELSQSGPEEKKIKKQLLVQCTEQESTNSNELIHWFS